jgi:hypothetical protein
MKLSTDHEAIFKDMPKSHLLKNKGVVLKNTRTINKSTNVKNRDKAGVSVAVQG